MEGRARAEGPTDKSRLGNLHKSVFQLQDATGDDYGPGHYSYPTDPVFTPGSFDLTSFDVSFTSGTVSFVVGISGEIDDPWSSGGGFSLQSIDIYIDKDGIEGSGATHTLEGRNATIATASAWEQMIWCAPPFDFFNSSLIDQYGNEDTSGIITSVDTVEEKISVSIPIEKIGEPDTSWAYIVAMLSQDGYSPGRVRPVNAERGQWVFGGGDDGDFDSNIIDMVLLPGLNQEGMLANYDPVLGLRPVLHARPDTIPPIITHTPVATAEEHLSIDITTEVTDALVTHVTVHYRTVGEGTYDESSLSRETEDIWTGSIPGEAVTLDDLEYFLYATDGTNSSTSPSDTSLPYRVDVFPDTTPPAILDASAAPDPFSPNSDGFQDTTLLTWTLTEPSYVSATVYDSTVQAQRLLLQDEFSPSGTNRTAWDGRDGAGEIVANGAYSVQFEYTDLADRPGTPVEIAVTVDTVKQRRLDLIFLFHFNQNLVPYGKVANTACYVGLLETLRAHPQSKFVIHISGSLTHDLLWFDDRAIQLIREGVQEGQFEIVGSTYIQNVMYSTRLDSLDFQFNDEQIKKHRRLIERVFGVSPTGFWNPERTWTQNFVALLADNGYEYVQVEDHILFDSGITGSEYLVRNTSYGGRELIIFNDDKTFEGWVNYIIDSGDYPGLIDFLHQLWNEDSTDQYAVCYHEDAEATGLWDYEGGENPQVDWEHLDAFLTVLENDPLLEITTYGDWLQGHQVAEEVTPIVDGAASWMGGDSWFAENNSQNMNNYRAFYDEIRDRLNEVDLMIENSPSDTVAASRLLDHAWMTLCAHQYEFGCHGLTEHSGFTDFDLARSALVSAQAAEFALNPQSAIYQDDVNDDAVQEVITVDSSNMWVFSPKGGRLLYWFDLEKGEELVGNENFMYYGENYVSDSRYVPTVRGGVDAYPWLGGNYIFPEIHDWTFEIRRRALNDHIEIDGAGIGDLVSQSYGVTLESDHVEFEFTSGQLHLTKVITPSNSTLEVVYTMSNPNPDSIGVTLTAENAFSPSYLDAMDYGRQSLGYWNGQSVTDSVDSSTIGVTNTRTGSAVNYEFVSAPVALSGQEVVFGLALSPTYELGIEGHESESVTYRLSSHFNSPPQPFSLILPPDGSSISFPVTFSWAPSQDPDSGDTVVYDLYLSSTPGFAESTTTVFETLEDESLTVDSLDGGTYHWKVVARDSWGSIRESSQVWSFSVSGSYGCGDSNGDDRVTIADATYLVNFIYRYGPPPLGSGDVNLDSRLTIADATYISAFIYRDGTPPCEPPMIEKDLRTTS